MTRATAHRHGGMTLVELLVVIGILGLLAVTVLPTFSSTGDRRKVRDAASSVSSFIAAGQSRALGSRSGGGLWIQPLPGLTASGAAIAVDVSDANVSAPYCGDATTSTVLFSSTSSGSSVGVTFVDGCNPPNAAGNLIRLGNSSALFDVTVSSGSAGTISMRSQASQTPENTFWPGQGASVSYEIIGPPTRSTVNAVTLADGVAIDITRSTFGAIPLTSGTSAFQLLFDSTGRPQLLARNGNREPFDKPLFLLIAPIESIQNAGALAPADGYWVAIDPRGGVPKIAEVDPTGGDPVSQQSFIRKGAALTAR